MKQKLKYTLKYVEPLINSYTLKVLNEKYSAKEIDAASLRKKRVLIFVPHVDDETIGLGGTIKKYTALGAEVKIVLVTDGAKSVSSQSPDEVTTARQKEMEKVKKVLGFHSINYLNLPDGNVSLSEENIRNVEAVIRDYDPEVIYTNILIDAHLDHVNTSLLVAEALKEIKIKQDLEICMYEINCLIPVSFINTFVDVTEEMQTKRETINIFASQAIDFDGFLNLNLVKSHLNSNPSLKAGEVFFSQKADHFIYFAEFIKERKADFPVLFKQANKTMTLLWAHFQNKKKKEKLYKEGISFASIKTGLQK